MTFLPSNGDQDWVVHELAELIARVGRERFLSRADRRAERLVLPGPVDG